MRESPWVLEEVRYAIRLKGGDELALPEVVVVAAGVAPTTESPVDLSRILLGDGPS